MAVATTGSPNTVPHSPTGRLEVTSMAPRSYRRLTSWRTGGRRQRLDLRRATQEALVFLVPVLFPDTPLIAWKRHHHIEVATAFKDPSCGDLICSNSRASGSDDRAWLPVK